MNSCFVLDSFLAQKMQIDQNFVEWLFLISFCQIMFLYMYIWLSKKGWSLSQGEYQRLVKGRTAWLFPSNHVPCSQNHTWLLPRLVERYSPFCNLVLAVIRAGRFRDAKHLLKTKCQICNCCRGLRACYHSILGWHIHVCLASTYK